MRLFLLAVVMVLVSSVCFAGGVTVSGCPADMPVTVSYDWNMTGSNPSAKFSTNTTTVESVILVSGVNQQMFIEGQSDNNGTVPLAWSEPSVTVSNISCTDGRGILTQGNVMFFFGAALAGAFITGLRFVL